MRRLVINLRETRAVWSIPDAALDEIRQAAAPHFDVCVVDAPADSRGDGGAPSDQAVEAVRDAEVYFGFGFPRPLFESARQGGHLRWVHTGTAGVGGSLYPEMVESDVVLTNSAGIHAEPIADTVLAGILHFARGLDMAAEGKAAHRWNDEAFTGAGSPLVEVAGSLLGVAGYGGIGRAVARRARALGMQVLALRSGPTTETEQGTEFVWGDAGMERLLAESRYLLISLPATPETRGFLEADRIGALRPDAVVINVGRGELVDEDALLEALRERRIRGAALDVFRKEPLPDESPLWDLPNVLITPHASGPTPHFWERQTPLILENLRRYLAGEELLNRVDKKAGY